MNTLVLAAILVGCFTVFCVALAILGDVLIGWAERDR
jgi:hypothetical protein